MNFGIVVESERDAAAYPQLIRKIRHDAQNILAIPCGGAPNLLRQFVGWVKHFEWCAPHSIDKALVIIDSDCSDESYWEAELSRIYEKSRFGPRFPVHFHATKCELETWLLADENAMSRASQSRDKHKQLGPMRIQFESYRNAKELFQKRLSEATLPDTPQVYKEIASHADLETIAAHCPHFQAFISKVRAC